MREEGKLKKFFDFMVTVGKKRHLGWVRMVSGSLGARTSRQVFVNWRFQIRAGCYQTFKAESKRLLLQQGRRDSNIKVSRLSSYLFKVSSVSTDLNWSPKYRPLFERR